MKVKLMRKVEHWRENGAVIDIIDRAEAAAEFSAGDGRYDDLIEEFSGRVALAIEDAGHEVVWARQQSRGVGAVVQGHDPQADDVYLAAVEACEAEFLADLSRFIAAEKEPVVVGQWGYGVRSAGHIVCHPKDREAVQEAYDAIEEGDLGPTVLDGVLSAGGWYREESE